MDWFEDLMVQTKAEGYGDAFGSLEKLCVEDLRVRV